MSERLSPQRQDRRKTDREGGKGSGKQPSRASGPATEAEPGTERETGTQVGRLTTRSDRMCRRRMCRRRDENGSALSSVSVPTRFSPSLCSWFFLFLFLSVLISLSVSIVFVKLSRSRLGSFISLLATLALSFSGCLSQFMAVLARTVSLMSGSAVPLCLSQHLICLSTVFASVSFAHDYTSCTFLGLIIQGKRSFKGLVVQDVNARLRCFSHLSSTLSADAHVNASCWTLMRACLPGRCCAPSA